MCLFFLYLRLYYHNYFITDLNKNDELYKWATTNFINYLI
jgi:hypothetical protein